MIPASKTEGSSGPCGPPWLFTPSDPVSSGARFTFFLHPGFVRFSFVFSPAGPGDRPLTEYSTPDLDEEIAVCVFTRPAPSSGSDDLPAVRRFADDGVMRNVWGRWFFYSIFRTF